MDKKLKGKEKQENYIYTQDDLIKKIYFIKKSRSAKIIRSYNKEQNERGIVPFTSYLEKKANYILDIYLVNSFFCVLLFYLLIRFGIQVWNSLFICISINVIFSVPLLIVCIRLNKEKIYFCFEHFNSFVFYLIIVCFQCIRDLCVENTQGSGNIIYDINSLVCCCFHCFNNFKYCRTSTYCPMVCFGRTFFSNEKKIYKDPNDLYEEEEEGKEYLSTELIEV